MPYADPKQKELSTLQQIENFLSEQTMRDDSLRIYRIVLERVFFRWVTLTARNPKAIGRADIVAFQKNLINKGRSLHTVCMYMSVLRRFYSWLDETGQYHNVARGVRNPRRTYLEIKRQPLDRPDLQRLADIVDRSTPKGRRDYALIKVILTCALRTIEAERLTIADLRLSPDGHTLMVHGKGSYEKSGLPLGDQAYKAIEDMLQDRDGLHEASPLFTNQVAGKNHRSITRVHIGRIIKQYMNAIGLTGRQYTTHSLRHSAATELARSGVRIEHIKYFMRHRSIKVTNIYLRMIEQDMVLNRQLSNLADHFIS